METGCSDPASLQIARRRTAIVGNSIRSLIRHGDRIAGNRCDPCKPEYVDDRQTRHIVRGDSEGARRRHGVAGNDLA